MAERTPGPLVVVRNGDAYVKRLGLATLNGVRRVLDVANPDWRHTP